jgi:phosphatidylinositol-3,4,5-trisphosphate 3-phosphatase and dual-specificity protein phosphatase PTEN
MAVRSLVSKKKVRFTEDGFDLDLTYVTPRVIAMGAPSQGGEALYRNPLPEVQRFFESRHPGQYKLYDLRAEPGAAYDAKLFDDRVAGRYRFFDHNPAPLALIRACVEDMHAWLQADTGNVVAVHCKAGKGRTGMIIACYLVYAGVCKTAAEALRFFGDVRTLDGKGVTIPSQMRYVHYFEHSLYRPVAPAVYRLLHVRLHSVPNFDVEGGCDPYFDVRLGDGRHCVFDYKQVREAACAVGGSGRRVCGWVAGGGDEGNVCVPVSRLPVTFIPHAALVCVARRRSKAS